MKMTVDEMWHEGIATQDNQYSSYCPYCKGEIDLPEESDIEYYIFDGEIYHRDCIKEMIEKYGRRYIEDTEQEQEFFQFNFGCVCTGTLILTMLGRDALFEDAEAVKEYVTNEIDDFVHWYYPKADELWKDRYEATLHT